MKLTKTNNKALALGYRNDGVIERIAKDENVSLEEATQLFKDTLMFLYMAATSSAVSVPTVAIDVGWHAFLMFTKDYADYCEKYLGKFVHHRPTTSRSKPMPQDAVSDCFKLSRQLFGSDLSKNWEYDMSGNCHDKCKGCDSKSCTD